MGAQRRVPDQFLVREERAGTCLLLLAISAAGARLLPHLREGGQRRLQGMVYVPGVHDHVTVGVLGPEGFLETSRPLVPHLVRR